MRQAMIYGDEEKQSTGSISARTIASAFSNANQRDKPVMLAFDEPELGLSPAYARALGEFIGQQTLQVGKQVCGVMVVTHSRELGLGLIQGLNGKPSLLTTAPQGEAMPETIVQWHTDTGMRTVEELLALPANSHQRYLAVKKMLRPDDPKTHEK